MELTDDVFDQGRTRLVLPWKYDIVFDDLGSMISRYLKEPSYRKDLSSSMTSRGQRYNL